VADMKVRELDRWPPEPGGAYKKPHGSPPAAEAIVDKVVYCRGGWLTFVCYFAGDLYAYDFEGEDGETCVALRRVLEANVGKSLASIGEIELKPV
jgi:hypothetical protein